MENENKGNVRVVKISRKKLIATIFVIILLVVLSAGIYRVLTYNSPTYSLTSQSVGMMAPSIPSSQNERTNSAVNPDNYLPLGGAPTIQDTREFMKTNYGADIKTRNVRESMRDVKGVIRDASGRIDQISENEKNGYVSFVVPKTNFDKFKDDIESITNEKLITEDISSQNLLQQKQGIEGAQKIVDGNLASLKKQNETLVANHNKKAKELKSAIDTMQGKLDQLNFLVTKITDQVQKTTLTDQAGSFQDNIDLMKQQLATENANYSANSKNLKIQIDTAVAQGEGVKQADTDFTDNIETVSGYISIRWISLWELAKIFSPIHPTIIVLVIIAIVWYVLRKKRVLPKVEFV